MGVGCPNMLKDEPVEKTSLAEQRALDGIWAWKEHLWPLEEEADNLGGLQKCCEIMQGENKKDQSPTRT